jgi:RNA polymerase sigma-70 factor, ECF subfamily
MSDGPTSTRDRFLELLRPLERDLEAYARRLLWEPQDLPDALQNGALRAFAAFDRYREGASFRAWMFTILTREVFALNRRHARRARHEYLMDPDELAALVDATEPPQPSSPSEPPVETGGSLDAILEPDLVRALRLLSDMERAVLLLRALNGFRYREISDALGIPLGSVMGDLSRARKKMRIALSRRSSNPACNPRR